MLLLCSHWWRGASLWRKGWQFVRDCINPVRGSIERPRYSRVTQQKSPVSRTIHRSAIPFINIYRDEVADVLMDSSRFEFLLRIQGQLDHPLQQLIRRCSGKILQYQLFDV